MTIFRQFILYAFCVLTLCFNTKEGLAQGIIGASGAEIGGIEPWDIPLAAPAIDTGIARRLAEICYPGLLQLDAKEIVLSGEILAFHANPGETLDALAQAEQETAEKILSVLVLLKKHAAEVRQWDESIVSNLAVGADWTFDSLEQCLTLKPTGELETNAVERRHWLTAVWTPVAIGLDLPETAKTALTVLGLAPEEHTADVVWSQLTLFNTLRKMTFKLDSTVGLDSQLQALLADLQTRILTPYQLGTSANDSLLQDRAEALLGCRSVAGLFKPELLDRWVLEEGEFVYDAFSSQADGAIRAVLQATTLLPMFLDGFIWQGHAGEDIAAAYAARHACFTALAYDLNFLDRERGASEDRTRLYNQYLRLLALFPPCLSPFLPEPAGEDHLKLSTLAEPEKSILISAETQAKLPQLKGGPATSIPYLCLLQADARRDATGYWQWQPRSAGLRHFLDEHLSR